MDEEFSTIDRKFAYLIVENSFLMLEWWQNQYILLKESLSNGFESEVTV